jgi:hypothetical protein
MQVCLKKISVDCVPEFFFLSPVASHGCYAVIFLTKLGRGLSLLILGKIIAKIAHLGSKKAGLS